MLLGVDRRPAALAALFRELQEHHVASTTLGQVGKEREVLGLLDSSRDLIVTRLLALLSMGLCERVKGQPEQQR